MAARKKRAARVARKAARRKPARTTTTITTTKVTTRKNPRRKNPPAGWRRSSEAAKHRQWKLSTAIERRTQVARRRAGPDRDRSAPLGPRLAALHASYARARDVEHRRSARERADEQRERRKARRGNPMKKKRTPAQKAAFRRMIAGLRAYKSGSGGKSRRKARRKAKAATVVVVRNPRRKRRKNSKGARIMAKHRRTRRHGTVARKNPHRKHRRRNPAHRRHRRRRNPGGGGMVSIVKSTIASAIPAIAAGGVMAILDAKLLGDKAMPVQVLGKLAAAAGVGYLLRNRPRTSALAMGAMLGGLGYQLAAKLNGGVVAASPKDAAKEISALIRQDPRAMASLVRTDGSLNTTPSLSGMGSSMGDGTALPTAPIYDPITLG